MGIMPLFGRNKYKESTADFIKTSVDTVCVWGTDDNAFA